MHIFSKLALVTGSALALTLAAVPVTHALNDGTAGGTGIKQANTAMVAEERAKAQAAEEAEKRKVAAQDKAVMQRDEAKLRFCQNKERVVGNIMGRMADRSQKHLDLFTTVSERVQKFYTDKGNTLSNYNELVATVNAKKVAAEAVIAKLKADQAAFTCSAGDPKGVSNSFKADQKAVAEALKAYRSAVKDLIKGVKSVQSTAENKTEGSQQ